MFQFQSFIQRLVGTSYEADDYGYPRCVIPPVEIVQTENSTVKRDKALTHLVRLNHHTHSVLYTGDKKFLNHNHVPHLLGSAYLFGADDKQLHDLYEREDPKLEPWKDSPAEVTGGDWRQYLGDEDYQRAFLDFFEDELVREGYDWNKVLMDYLLDEQSPLLNSLFCGGPLIHFGYAIELNSREIAMEALTLAATCHDYLHKYVDMEVQLPTTKSTSDPLVILQRVCEDPRFDGICNNPGVHNGPALFQQREDVILEYYNQLDLDKSDSNMREVPVLENILEALTKTTVLMLITTHKVDHPQFDVVLCSALNSLYAVRILLPVLPAKYHTRLIKGHWLFTLFVYLTQMRPSIKTELLTSEKVDSSGGWDLIDKNALEKGLGLDSHYIQALRTMKEFAKLYSQNNQFYLLAASKFAVEFHDWVGLQDSKHTLDIKA